jgi:hypothetical protein
MQANMTALERAFELAKSGDCSGVAEVRAKLSAEGYAVSQITGPTLMRQLRELCAAAAVPE